MILKLSTHFKTLMELTLEKTYTTRSACSEFLSHISDVMKEEVAAKLRQSNLITVMADGGSDFGILEVILVFVRYLNWELGRPVNL